MSVLTALSLDAMASVAYGPEAIVLVLAVAGAHGLGFTLPVTLAIAGLLAVLVASYRQVIAAFPDGGGSSAVAKTHLGARTSLVAAASLVLDYVLNVAVAVTAGVAALTSAFPELYDGRLCLAVLVLITGVNLRGIVESARAFIVPTAVFVVSILVPPGRRGPCANRGPGARLGPVEPRSAADPAHLGASPPGPPDRRIRGRDSCRRGRHPGDRADRRGRTRPAAAAAAAEPAGRGRRPRRTEGHGRGDRRLRFRIS